MRNRISNSDVESFAFAATMLLCVGVAQAFAFQPLSHSTRCSSFGESRPLSILPLLPSVLSPFASRQQHRRRTGERSSGDRVVACPNAANEGSSGEDSRRGNGRRSIREKVKQLAKSVVVRPISSYAPVVSPKAIAAVITDATAGAVDMALEELYRLKLSRASFSSNDSFQRSNAFSTILEQEAMMEGDTALALDAISLAKTTAADAFCAAQTAIQEAEHALANAKLALQTAKDDAARAMATAERSAAEARRSAERATALAAVSAAFGDHLAHNDDDDDDDDNEEEQLANKRDDLLSQQKTKREEENKQLSAPLLKLQPNSQPTTTKNVSDLSYEDVPYHMSEMAPPFLDEDQCLIPGEAMVRVEKAPDNSRRIFAGIDIMASVDDVWKVLTDYDNLQNVVPNLVVNEVLELYDGANNNQLASFTTTNSFYSEEDQCKYLTTQMKGAKLRQVGGARVVGINFSARTTLEVREWPQGMPDFAHFTEDVYEGQSRTQRATKDKGRKLQRYRFPRPFAISKLPTKDISMQSVERDDGEFRLYQGVWRMQPLPGCAPPGGSAMRLTYAVEISPRSYLPVGLVEGRIAQDLCANLRSVRDYVSDKSMMVVR